MGRRGLSGVLHSLGPSLKIKVYSSSIIPLAAPGTGSSVWVRHASNSLAPGPLLGPRLPFSEQLLDVLDRVFS